MADWNTRAGDDGHSLNATLTDEDGTAIDLTGATVELEIWGTRSKTVAATIVSAAAGTVTATPALTVPGSYSARFKVTFADTTVRSFPSNADLHLAVRANG